MISNFARSAYSGDEAEVIVYGNQNIARDKGNRPLVTFAVFAYEQEQFIKEAVEGALAQTYQPLEVVISDDCSKDSTFETIKKLLSSYRGPHRVVARRAISNQGIIDHILSVARISLGELIIVAAGDDVSYPHRSQDIVNHWISSGAVALFSGADICDHHGKIIQRNYMPKPLDRIQSYYRSIPQARRYDGRVRNVPGYSAAYSKEFLALFPLCSSNCNNEDTLFTHALNLSGSLIEAIPASLMCRRNAKGSISVGVKPKAIKDVEFNERKMMEFALNRLSFYEYMANLDFLYYEKNTDLFKIQLTKERCYYELVSEFWSLSTSNRARMLINAPSLKNIKYALPRMLGMAIFGSLVLLRGLIRDFFVIEALE